MQITHVKVARPFREGAYLPLMREQPVYRVGEVTEARCPCCDHEPPTSTCGCGIYSAAVRGLRWVEYLLSGRDVVLLAVRPVGRALTDGHVVRSEKVLILGEVTDWRALLPRRLRKMDTWALREVAGCYRMLRQSPWDRILAVHLLWRILGRPMEPWRCAAVHRTYLTGHTSEKHITQCMLRSIAGECVYCAEDNI